MMNPRGGERLLNSTVGKIATAWREPFSTAREENCGSITGKGKKISLESWD